jgi:hypothetical protein
MLPNIERHPAFERRSPKEVPCHIAPPLPVTDAQATLPTAATVSCAGNPEL